MLAEYVYVYMACVCSIFGVYVFMGEFGDPLEGKTAVHSASAPVPDLTSHEFPGHVCTQQGADLFLVWVKRPQNCKL